MRWLVEVTSLGKTETESLYVDAESWQKALQTARGQRGESAPMSGFSIELLDDGCRAIDPMSRIRYEVRRAPEDGAAAAPQAPSASVRASAPPAAAQPALMSRGAPASVPRPASQPPPASVVAAPRPSPSVDRAAAGAANAPSSVDRVAAGAANAPSGVDRAAISDAPASKRPPSSAAALSSVTATSGGSASLAAQTMPLVAPAPAPGPAPAPATARADVGLNVPSQVIFKREHDATDTMPLTYREYVFLVPAGTSESAAETLLQTQLELVLASLARVPAGKLVNLGVFDVAFQGKPPVPPLATLSWKDWRGAPLVEFPRRPGYVPRPSAPPPAVPPPAVPPPATVAPAPAAVPIEPVAAPIVETPPAEPAPSPVVTPPPVAPLPLAAQPEPVPQPLQASQPPRSRVRGEDLIAVLFESMHDLHFLRDAVEGGDFCLGLAIEKIPSQAGMVHLYDIDRREFLVTSTRGTLAGKLLLHRHAENDPVLSAAMGKRRAIVLSDATQSDATTIERYVTLGGAQSLLIAPVMQAGRFLGAIELINPLDGQPFTDAEGNALTYIAEQFAEFVATRGVITDPERIGSRSGFGA